MLRTVSRQAEWLALYPSHASKHEEALVATLDPRVDGDSLASRLLDIFVVLVDVHGIWIVRRGGCSRHDRHIVVAIVFRAWTLERGGGRAGQQVSRGL